MEGQKRLPLAKLSQKSGVSDKLVFLSEPHVGLWKQETDKTHDGKNRFSGV